MIDITGKKDQHVVKCGQCNEATPIRNAPPGKLPFLFHYKYYLTSFGIMTDLKELNKKGF